jgi:hypothetical protein
VRIRVARQRALQDAFRRFFRREIADWGASDLRRLAASEKLFMPKVTPAGFVVEFEFVLDLEAPVRKRQKLHRCGREAVIPGCLAGRSVRQALYLAPVAISRMTGAPGMDELLLIGGSHDESRDSACVGIGVDPAAGNRIRAESGDREEEREEALGEFYRTPPWWFPILCFFWGGFVSERL